MNDDYSVTAFGEMVRKLRAQTGLTQAELAKLSHALAPALTREYPDYRLLSGLSRELIIKWEAPVLKERPRDRNLIVLAYALAEGKRRATGEDASGHDIYLRLLHAARPLGADSVSIISEEAALADMVISGFPADERKAKWKAIIALLETEYKERFDPPKPPPNVNFSLHTDD